MESEYLRISKEIRNQSFSPVYFFEGKEPFYIDNLTSLIESNALEESQKAFNLSVVYGKDTDLASVVVMARKYPMMGERQVVIVKEAQEMREWNNEDKQQVLIHYLENPLSSTILVFAYKYKNIDKRKKLAKTLEKKTIFLNSKKIYDDKVPHWIQSYCHSKGIEIEDQAVALLSENIGNNLERIANEVDKLILNIEEKKPINAKMVHRYIGISKEYNLFELQKSVGSQNKFKAHKIMNYFSSNSALNPPALIIYSLFTYFTKLLLLHSSKENSSQKIASTIGVSPFFVSEYVRAAKNYSIEKVVENLHYLHEADLHSKGIGSVTRKEKSLLTELVYKLMK